MFADFREMKDLWLNSSLSLSVFLLNFLFFLYPSILSISCLLISGSLSSSTSLLPVSIFHSPLFVHCLGHFVALAEPGVDIPLASSLSPCTQPASFNQFLLSWAGLLIPSLSACVMLQEKKKRSGGRGSYMEVSPRTKDVWKHFNFQKATLPWECLSRW